MNKVSGSSATSNYVQSSRFRSLKTESIDLIQRSLRTSSRPVILSSFGKESLVLISLAQELGTLTEVAYFEPGFAPHKHAFARRAIAHFSLNPTLLQPHRTSLIRGLNDMSLAYSFRLAGGSAFHISITYQEGPETEWRCGLQSDLRRNGNHPPYSWDMLICGRRNSDVDISLGSLRWEASIEKVENGSIVMPLLAWTDEDVFYYLRSRAIEPDRMRYDVVGSSYKSRPDLISNPDHAPYCIRCFSARQGISVFCPQVQRDITAFAEISEIPEIFPNKVSPKVMC